MEDLAISDGLDQIQCRTLILCGVKDRPNRGSARELNRQIQGSVFSTVDGAAYEVNIDNPAALSAVIAEFWKS